MKVSKVISAARSGRQKNVLDLEGHQVVEASEEGFGFEEGLGDGVAGHGKKALVNYC
jgi:hypothetical protein